MITTLTLAFVFAGPPASKSDRLPTSTEEVEETADAEPSQDDATPPAPAEPSTPQSSPTVQTGASPFVDPTPAAPEPVRAAPVPSSVGLTRSAPTYRSVPIRWRLDFTLGLGGTQVSDTGYLAFDDDRSMLGFDVGARWDHRIGERVFLGLGARYNRFASDRTPYDGLLSSELTVHEPAVHGRASVRTVEGIDVFADLGAGPTIVLDRVASQTAAAQQRRSVTGAFSAAGGISLYLPKKWLRRKGAARVTGGLETSIGYQFRGAIDVSTDRDLGEEPLPSVTADFGDLAMRGFVWRAGFFLRVM